MISRRKASERGTLDFQPNRRSTLARIGLQQAVLLPCLYLAWIAFSVLAGAIALSAEDAPMPDKAPLLYRKVFVPDSAIRNRDPIAVGTEAYFPIKREEFDRLLSEARVKNPAAQMTVESRIDQGTYAARLEDDLVIAGTARLSIVHSGESPAVLPLNPCNLAIERAVWLAVGSGEADDTPAGLAEPVQVGLEESGEIVVVADRSGTVQFDWSLRGKETVAGELAFDLRLPSGMVSHFTLVLKEELEPIAEGAVVTRGAPAEEDGYRSWLIELPNNGSAALKIGAAGRKRSAESLVLLRQQTTCRINSDLADVIVHLSLDVHQQPLSHLTLDVDGALNIVSVSVGAETLPWSETKLNARRQVTLEFPEALSGIGREITLRGVTDVLLGRLWRVPRATVRDALWLEGTTTLEVPQSLAVDEMVLTGCRQTDGGPLAAPQQGESIQIQDYQPRSVAQVLLNVRDLDPVARIGTTVELGATATTLHYVADIEAGSVPRFLLEMDAPADWRVDSLETQPAEMLAKWRSNRQRIVQVYLKSGLTQDSPIQVTIHAHRDGLRPEEALSGKELRLGTFRDVATARSVVVLAAEAPRQLHMAGDTNLTRLAPSNLTEADRRLVQTAPGAVAFVDGDGADDLAVSLSTSPNFEASIRIDSDFRHDQVQHEYSIACLPEASSLDRVQIQFTDSLVQPLQWTWIGDTEIPVDATRVDDEDSAVDSAVLGETWRIMLPQPQDRRFKLRAVGTSDFRDKSPVPLISVLGAKAQRGTVTIRSTDATPIKIVQRGLTAVPAEVPPQKDYSSARGVFRYEPSLEGRLFVERTDSAPRDLARVWVCQVDSRLYRDGQGAHTAVYRIENNGNPVVNLMVPREVKLSGVLIDNQPLALAPSMSLGKTLAVALPPGRRFPSLTVHYTTRADRLRPISNVTVPWLDLDLPVFQRRWVLWLPPGYETSPAVPGEPSSAWKRLFGPLLRQPDRLRFDPLLREHWQAAFELDDPPAGKRAVQWGELFLRCLGDALKDARSNNTEPAGVTWAVLLNAAEQRAAEVSVSESVTILVDRERLSARGVEPESVVETGLSSEPLDDGDSRSLAESGSAVLSDSGLALVAHDDWLVITTDEAIAFHGKQGKSSQHRSLWVANDLRQPRGPVQCPNNLPRTNIAGWVALSETPHICWAADEDAIDAVVSQGWTGHLTYPAPVHVVDSSVPFMTSAVVLQSDFWPAAAWGVFLVSAGLAGWLFRGRVLIGIPATALAAVAAVFCSDMLAPIMTSCYLGVLCSTVFLLIRPVAMHQADGVSNVRRPGTSIIVLKNATALIVLVIVWLSVAFAEAQQPRPGQTEERSNRVYRVLLPIRGVQGAEVESLTPEGPYVYVPLDFLSQLRRETPGAGGEAREWMIEDALYRAVFEWDIAKEHLLAKELVAEYKLRTYRNEASVVLPFVQEQVYLLPNRAYLDGDPASAAWEPDGAGLSVECPDSGNLQLKLVFRPRVDTRDALSGFDVKIPPVANARMLLQLPADAIGVQCPTALGRSRRDEQSGHRVVQVGPTDTLVAQWSDDPYFDTRSSGVEVDQFMWLHIRPGAVVLKTKFLVSCLTGQVRELKLSADPRLRMLPPAGDGPIVDRNIHDEASQSIHLLLRTPVSQEAAFEADFVLTEASGIGVVRVPRIEAFADRTNRRWLGVTVDESLRFDVPPGDGPRDVDTLDFVGAWGSAESPPQVAVSLPDNTWDFSLATRPRQPKLAAAIGVDLSCGRSRARLQFAAEIEPADNGSFQYRLDAPPALDIDSVSILLGDDQQVTHWSRGRTGQIVVRVKQPISQKHRLAFEATMPIATATEIRLPRITLLEADITSEEVRLYRRPNVQLDVTSVSGYVDIPGSPVGQYTAGSGRLESAVRLASEQVDSPTIQFTVSPNEPVTEGTLLSFLRRRQDAWQAEVLYELRVESGIVDALRFDIPAEWTGPLETDFEAGQEMVDIPGKDRRYLVLHPLQALTETTRLRVWGDLSSRPGERARAPDIIPLDVEPIERYLIAPTVIGQQAVTWKTTGLHYTELPARFADLKQEDEEVYLAYQPQFQATIGDVEQEAGSAGVDLADIHIDCQSGLDFTGSATFDVQPAGQSHCDLELPVSCHLLHAAIDGLPASLQRKGSGRWQLQLGPRQLAQQLQIIYRGQLVSEESAEDLPDLPAPRLPGLSVRKTLWTVQVPRSKRAKLRSAGTPVDAWQQEVIRFNESAERIESASEVLAEIDPDVAQRWYLTWIRRAAASRGRIMFWTAKCVDLDEQRIEQSNALDRRYQSILAKLAEAGLVAPEKVDASLVCRMSDVWSQAHDDPHARQLRLATEGQDPVKFEQWAGNGDNGRQRWAAVAVLLSLAFVASLLVPFPGPEMRRFHVLAICAAATGCIWWYACSPSFLGLVLVTVSVLAWLADCFSRIRARFPAFRIGTKWRI